ncbi:hypothetical protein GUJ93_ZPchr0676g2752 [Zizania palustris]|uniref:Inositol-tetrakisphosphate 1-kinase 6 n=1 Tax=Zizania palustris TaxID=103762 RepID=A0A8J5UUB5_ZIZPA|nr:hypothetical protein GUJ93_ZPchr0676g2752 [Zizania palustris]
MGRRSVRVVLESSILLAPSSRIGGGVTGEDDDAAQVALRPGAEALLRRLRYSNLGVAICHPDGLPTNESGFLEKTANLYSLGYIPLTSPSGKHLLNELMLEWSRTNSCFFVTSRVDEGLLSELQNHNWTVIAIDNEYITNNSGVIHIGMLQELLVTLATSIKRIINIDPNLSISFPKGISFSLGMSEIIRFVEEHRDFCVIDPFKNIYPLLDRLQIQEILVRLEGLNTEGKPKIRAPCSLKVGNFCGSELQKQLAEANLSFPLIVKPQVACGVADAHNMALIFKIEEFSNLSVPLPAILQEYIDHGSKIFKFYAIGDKIFHAIKNSMPNASHLKCSSGEKPLTFNSLKTLPVATKEQLLQNRVLDSKSLDINLVEEAANFLKELLGLTIFGFDVVVSISSIL